MTGESATRRPRARRRLLRYRGLFPVVNLLAAAILLALSHAFGIAETLYEGFRGRVDTGWLATLLFFAAFTFGLTAILFPFYWIEQWLGAVLEDDTPATESPVWFSMSQLGIDWLIGSGILVVLYAGWTDLPLVWPLPVFLLFTALAGMNHPRVIEWTMHRLPEQWACDDVPLNRTLTELIEQHGGAFEECREWNDDTQDLPIPAPGVVIRGRSPVTVFLPMTLRRTWPIRTLIAAVTHHLLIRKAGVATWRMLIDAAIATWMVSVAKAVTLALGPGQALTPDRMALPMAIAAGLLILLRPLSYTINHLWIHRIDRVTAETLGGTQPVADLIRKTRALNRDPARLPILLELLCLDGPSAHRRIRKLRQPGAQES